MLEDNINAGFGRDPPNFVRDLLFVVTNSVIGAEFASFLQLRFIPSGRNHGGTEHLANLNRCRTHTRSPAQHQHCIAGSDVRSRNQHVPRRQKHERNTGSLLVRHPVWDWNHVYFGNC